MTWTKFAQTLDIARNLGAPQRRVVGQSLDEKSSLCPISVQTLSNVCPMTCKVQGLSSRCPQSVEILSKPEVT